MCDCSFHLQVWQMKLSIFSYVHLPNVCHTHHHSQQQLARSVLVRGSPDCSAHIRFYPCHYVTYLMLLISEAYWASLEQALSGERGWLTCQTCPCLHLTKSLLWSECPLLTFYLVHKCLHRLSDHTIMIIRVMKLFFVQFCVFLPPLLNIFCFC